MSWPQWQPPVQPTMPMLNATMPMGIQYSAEQWQQMQQQNWQQWAQWQQQYQQWHQQYGAEYQKSLTAMASIGNPATVINTAAPPPLPSDTKPPPPPEDPIQHSNINSHQPPVVAQNTSMNQNDAKNAYGYNINAQNKSNSGSGVWVAPSNNTNQQNNARQHPGKRQALEFHNGGGSSKKNKLDWQPPPAQAVQAPAPTANTFGPHLPEENKEDLSDPEKKFMTQFAEWEAQFNKWKEQNQDHPDKTQYREYEKKWEAWRNQLLDRRELMRKKRLGLVPANVNINTSFDTHSSPDLTPSSNMPASLDKKVVPTEAIETMINPINSKALATLFKSNANDGIPGLDLVDAPAQPDEVSANKKPQEVGAITTGTSKAGLNLDDLSKNLNSILGDQKLLSMLSLVAQSTSGTPALKTESNNVRNAEVQSSHVKTTPSGITLAPPKVSFDDQNSNWSLQTATSGNSNSWSQEHSNQINRDNFQNKVTNFANVATSNIQNTTEQSPNSQLLLKNIKTDQFYSERSDAQCMPNTHEDDHWSSNIPSGAGIPKDSQNDMPPAPPMITSIEEMLNIENIVDYGHKPLKQDTTDVRVFTPRLFDYRHKLVTRIPLPERPKWLSESFHNIPEFNPPISRIAPYSRNLSERYPPVPQASVNRYDISPFSRRPVSGMPDKSSMAYENSANIGRSDDFRRRNNKDEYEKFKSPSFGGQGNRNDDRERDRERDRFRDRERNREKEFTKTRDIKRDLKDTPAYNAKKNVPVLVESFRNIPKENVFLQNQQIFGAAANLEESRKSSKTSIDDILNMPGRAKRPQRIVIILRGPPGSGKTFLAKQIKDKETENGGSAPRILSLDDYFMVEQEKEIVEDGKTTKVKEMVYEFEECMETSYRQSLLKTFKKTITDGYFPFIIVDNINDKLKYFDEMWSFAKQNGFQVYVCQLDLDVQLCTKRNTHGRSEVEIQHIVNGWEELPSHYGIIDATHLIQAGAITEVEMEEINSPNDNFDDDNIEEQTCNSSKWDNFECSIDNLAKLDGINKPLRSARTMEDYLQLDEWTTTRSEVRPGQRRVRWADLEERKEQEKMRAIGFVVGQTDWGRMMDPTLGGSALTQTKYIERVGIRKVNTN